METETVLLTYALADGESPNAEAMVKAIETRLNRFKFGVVAVRALPKGQFEIELQVKNDNELDALKKLIGKTQAMEIRILASKELHKAEIEDALNLRESREKSGKYFWAEFDPKKLIVDETVVTRVNQAGRNELLVIDDELDMDGSYIQSVMIGRDSKNRPSIQGQTTGEGAFLMAQLTSSRTTKQKRRLAVIFNHKVLSAPPITEMIAKNFEITGDFTEQELVEMVDAFKSGGFPARLDPKPVSERRIGKM